MHIGQDHMLHLHSGTSRSPGREVLFSLMENYFFDNTEDGLMSFAQGDNNTPVEESLSFLARPETIKELIEAASGRRRSSQESIRSLKKNCP